ncbi:MAG: cytochrome c biogenesis protein CcsA [Acidilobaceae archaeon]
MLDIHYTGLIMISGIVVLVSEVLLLLLAKKRVEALGYVGLVLTLLGYVLYVYSFVVQDYSLKPVYETSAPGLPLLIKIGSSWAGGGSSLVLFVAVLSTGSLIARLIVKTLNPVALTLSNALVVSGTILAMLLGAFEKTGFDATTGMGINPLLKSLWLLPHPLTVFAAYSLIPLSAALELGRHGQVALNTARIGWIFLTLGNVTGGYWAYTTLGWGGYWAWDPVETSTLVPWLFLTAYFHSIPFSKRLASAMLYLSASSVFLSMAVTRTGLSPLHGFAEARTIAIGILFLFIVAFLVLALNETSKESMKTIEKVVESKSPYLIGMLASFIALLIASLVVYIVLLIPVGVSAIGRDATQITLAGDSFVKATYPLLFPAFLIGILSMPLCSLRERLSLRTHLVLAVASLIAGTILAIQSYRGYLVWSPLSSIWTNVMISLSLPPLALALASSAISVILSFSKFTHRTLGLSLLHFSLALLALGVILSGPFAYNQRYFSDFVQLKVGEEVDLGDVKVKFLGYEYQVFWEPVDVYNAYKERLPYYKLSGYWTLLLIATEWTEAWSKAYKGMKLLESFGILEVLGNHSLTLSIEEEMSDVVILREQNKVLELKAEKLVLELETLSINLDYGLENINATDIRYAILTASFSGSVLIELSMSEEAQKALESKIDSVIVKPSNLKLNMRGVTLSVHNLTLRNPLVKVSDEKIVLEFSNMTVDIGGLLESVREVFQIPSLILSEEVYYYSRLSSERSDLWNILLKTGYAEILTNETAIMTMIERTSGRALSYVELRELTIDELARLAQAPPLPSTLPEGAKLLLHFEIRKGNEVYRQTVEARFDINGELQGIKGTVPKPLVIRTGLTEIYVEPYLPFYEKSIPIGGIFIYMPMVHGMMAQVPASISLPESLMFYLHEVFKELDPIDKIGVAMVLSFLNMKLFMPPALANAPPEIQAAAAKWLDPLTQSIVWVSILTNTETIEPFFQRIFTLRISLSMLESMTPALFHVIETIENFKPENSTLVTQGLLLRVKTVHYVNLVWIGSLALLVSEIYIVAISLLNQLKRENQVQ